MDVTFSVVSIVKPFAMVVSVTILQEQGGTIVTLNVKLQLVQGKTKALQKLI